MSVHILLNISLLVSPNSFTYLEICFLSPFTFRKKNYLHIDFIEIGKNMSQDYKGGIAIMHAQQ